MADEPVKVDIKGIEETCAMLDQVPKTIAVKGFFKGCEAAGQVFIDAVWPLTPLDLKAAVNKAHGGKGALVGGLDAFITLDAEGRFAECAVGFGKSLGHIANWVEFGHRMVGHKPEKKLLGFVVPHPFMGPAFLKSYEAAIDAFAEGLRQVVVEEYKQS